MNTKEKREWIELTDRDKEILNLLARFRVMFAFTILMLVGMTDNYGRKRLAKLVRLGYIEQYTFFVNRPAVYTVTNKGLSAIGSDMPYYSIQNDNAYHEAMVSMAVCWLVNNHDINIDNILTEREMRKQEIKFGNKERTLPDLYIPDKSLSIEYERTPKTTDKLRRKIENNASKCSRQLWIIDEDNTALSARIDSIADEIEEENPDIIIAQITKEFIEERLQEGPSSYEKETCKQLFE